MVFSMLVKEEACIYNYPSTGEDGRGLSALFQLPRLLSQLNDR